MAKLFFLALLILLPASLRAQTLADNKSADQLGWELAVHSYTFQKFSIFDAIDKTAALGLKYMSFSGTVSLDGTNKIGTTSLSDKDIAAIKAKLKSAGIIKVLNIGVVQLSADEAQCRKVFAFAKTFGIDTLVSEPATNAFDIIEKLCTEYNIKVAIHNHPQGHSVYWSPDIVAEYIKGRSPLIGDCADIGHWLRSGLDPVECLKKLDGRIICLHFKDLNRKGEGAHDVPWGTGVGTTKEVMEELKRQNFHGGFCVEYEYHWENSSPEIAECVKFFNMTCDELAGKK